MARVFDNWITGFLDYTGGSEAPPHVYFWVAVATIAAGLQRRVYFDQVNFKWYPNLYTILVAPPGVIAKSTTADLGFDLLRQVEGINMGPTVSSMQALLDAFAQASQYEEPPNGEPYVHSSLAIISSELGNLLNPQDKDMVDMLTNLWDGKPIDKRTRKDGKVEIQAPNLDILGCTTPSWIAGNFPQYMIGGGFTSRCLFVYAEEKANVVAYLKDRKSKDNFLRLREGLINDLAEIRRLHGEITISREAADWGTQWYEHFIRVGSKQLDETVLSGYINRKQTLAHKIAMALTVADKSHNMEITLKTLQQAVGLLSELETSMPKIYSKIGLNRESQSGNDLVSFIRRNGGTVAYPDLYRWGYAKYPRVSDFDNALKALAAAGHIIVKQIPGKNSFNVSVA